MSAAIVPITRAEGVDARLDRVAVEHALGMVKRVAPKRSTLPILSMVLLEVGSDPADCALIATDLEVSVRAPIGYGMKDGPEVPGHARVHTPGRVMVDPKGFAAALAASDERTVDVVQMASGLFVGGARVACQSAEEYPTLDWPMLREPMAWTRLGFAKGTLASVTRAASTDETRYNLNALHLERATGGAQRWIAVATDGHRLHHAELVHQSGAWTAQPKSVLLPAPALLAKLVGTDTTLRIDATRREVDPAVFVELDGGDGCGAPIYLRIRPVSAEFPKWARVVPKKSAARTGLSFDPAEFERACKLARGLGAEQVRLRACGSSLELDFQPHALPSDMVYAYRVDEGAQGVDVHLLVDLAYLREAVASVRVNGSRVYVYVTDELSPLLITGGHADALGAVVMPMRK